MEKPRTKTKLKPPDGHNRIYSSLIRETNSFNGRLLAERTSRLPFIDTQTGIAQSDCNLWRSEKERVRCQANDTQSSWNECRLYSYPSLVRRKRPQMSYERTRMPQNNVDSCRLPGALASCSASTYGLEAVANKERAGLMRAGAYTTMSHRDQQRPPRADSTGSHSFADSDSRDQSSTGTSQSVESPRSQLLDDEQPLSNLNYLTIGGEHKGRGKRNSLGQDGEHELNVSIGQDSFRLVKKSKLSRGGNMGSSLIKSVEQSLLIKSNRTKITNGRKTAQNGRGAKAAATNKTSSLSNQTKSVPCGSKQAQDARPYVCPICDQTYKTRPGLSYHFIHSHDTVLPRNLPVKIESDKPMESKRANGSTSDALKLKKERPARIGMKQEEPTTRVLRRGRRVADEHDEVHGKANALADEPTHEQAPIEEPTRIEQVVSDQATDQHPKFQETNEPEPTDLAGLDKNQGELDDDDNETVIEMSLSQSSPAYEATLSKLSDAIQGDSGKTWPHEDENETIPEDGTIRKIDGKQSDHTTGQSRTNNRRSIFCDFCLGTVDKNRRTCLPEELISCSNCGSSGHPSCLRFSENICRSVKKYNWQCLECKTCSTCDQADHEDQMLFCDDCDRSYHTYCLSPRLEHPPEGSWTCRECQDEYYKEGQK